MERSEAKEGVRVRYSGDSDPSYTSRNDTLGQIIRPERTMAYVRFDDGETLPCRYKTLEVVTEPWLQVDTVIRPRALSPVVTETRRYVKEGDYGILRVVNVSHVKGAVGLLLVPSSFGSYTAEQLREAAHTLNQIAEVLEENK